MRLSSRPRIPGEIEFGMIYGGIAVIILVAAGLFPVVEVSPPCVFRSITAVPCPTCGSTRAVWELAHGHFSAALRLNPLISSLIGAAVIALAVNAVVLLFRLRRPVLILSSRGAFYSRAAVLAVFLVNWVYLIIIGR